jgi:putative addiction module killer protein
MIEIRKAETFAECIDGLQDIRARARILVRIESSAAGNPGDVKPVGEGMTQVARDAGLSRESLYKALSGERTPMVDIQY